MSEQFTMLKTNDEVRRRIAELAVTVSKDYSETVTADNPLLVLCTLRGAVFFSADLVRSITVPIELDFLKVHSYQGTRPAGIPVFDLGEKINVSGRHVLIVEDIVDTGQTMRTVLSRFREQGAASLRICTMLDKPSRRFPECRSIVPEYIGFSIPDLFVVGWGLDYDEQFRLLPDIMVYHPEAAAKDPHTR